MRLFLHLQLLFFCVPLLGNIVALFPEPFWIIAAAITVSALRYTGIIGIARFAQYTQSYGPGSTFARLFPPLLVK